MSTRLQFSEHKSGDVTVVELAGQLVAEDEALAFREYVDGLIRGGRLKFVINLDAVSYMDSGGIGSLVAKFVSLRQRGGELKIASPTARVARVLAITGLRAIFEVFDSEDAAVRSFLKPSQPVAALGRHSKAG